MKKIKLYLIRHGQSEGNVNSQVYHTTRDCDVKLTTVGHKQSLDAGEQLCTLLQGQTPRIICSSYTRAKQTAQNIYTALTQHNANTAVPVENVLLREREWGALRNSVDNRNFTREEHFNFYYRAQGGESYADAYLRVATFFQGLFCERLQCPNDDRPIIIVSHGECIRLALMYLDGNTVEHFTVNRKNPKNCEIITRILS
jgi:broad specificity phosphatase PhoE